MWMGGEFGENGYMYMYIYIIYESLHCSPETVTTLLINYNPIQNKKCFVFFLSTQTQCHRGKKGHCELGVLVVALPPAHYTPIHESFLSAGAHWLHWLVSKGISSANVIGYDDIQESLKYLLFNNGTFIRKNHCWLASWGCSWEYNRIRTGIIRQ